jgi:hypothetical protein
MFEILEKLDGLEIFDKSDILDKLVVILDILELFDKTQ